MFVYGACSTKAGKHKREKQLNHHYPLEMTAITIE